MAYSGTYNQTKITVDQLVAYAMRDAGRTSEEITPEYSDAGKQALFYILQNSANRGINIWLQQNVVLGAQTNQQWLNMPTNYVSLSFGSKISKGSALIAEIKEMIKGAEKGSVVYFNVQSEDYKNNKDAGDKLLSVILQDLSDYASDYRVKLCVYPHFSLYCETLEHSLKLAKLVSRNNFGCVINLCHLLKVEGSEGIEQKIKSLMPYLIAVNICGADGGNTQQLGWDRLIQPLGEGSFDTYNFVRILWDAKYKGPVGLQCYNLKGEALEVLTRSFQTFQEYKKRYVNQK